MSAIDRATAARVRRKRASERLRAGDVLLKQSLDLGAPSRRNDRQPATVTSAAPIRHRNVSRQRNTLRPRGCRRHSTGRPRRSRVPPSPSPSPPPATPSASSARASTTASRACSAATCSAPSARRAPRTIAASALSTAPPSRRPPRALPARSPPRGLPPRARDRRRSATAPRTTPWASATGRFESPEQSRLAPTLLPTSAPTDLRESIGRTSARLRD